MHNSVEFYLCQFTNSLADILDPIMFNVLQKWLSQFPHTSINYDRKTSDTIFRRAITPTYHLNLPHSSYTLNHTYMKFLQPQELSHPSAASDKIEPTLQLLGFHPSRCLPKPHAKLTNDYLHKLYYHHSTAYTNICNLFRSSKASSHNRQTP